MDKGTTYVGMDVHKRTIAVSVIWLTERTGEMDVAVSVSAAMPSSFSVLSDNVAGMEFSEV